MPDFTPKFIDTHGHVNFNAFKDVGEEVVKKALDEGVGIIMPGSQIDTSKSLDQNLFVWESGDDSYIHWKVESAFSWHGFDLAIGVEGTDLDTYGETRLLAKVSRTFDF